MRRICVDFDGVIHSYTSGWCGVDVVVDPPVPGALDFIRSLVDDERFCVAIYSARSASQEGRSAMESWLRANGLECVEEVEFPAAKPPSFVYIDDRGWRFEGIFPELDELAALEVWYARTTESGIAIVGGDE